MTARPAGAVVARNAHRRGDAGWRRRVACVLALAGVLSGTGCAGRYGAARAMAGTGALLASGGGLVWGVGERTGHTAGRDAAFVSVAIGAALVLAAGGVMAAASSCRGDADCGEEETCIEVPPIQGGLPYRQCVPR